MKDEHVYEYGKTEDEHEHEHKHIQYIDPEYPTNMVESERCVCGDAKNVKMRPATQEEIEDWNRKGFIKQT